ncbi:translation initiation factor eIF-2B subunit epsilon [Apiospora kogelbergensis]|uniref:translation initiation factor eIF-2B subunit epsilon n=1 Tax=Apiospora kogelbergensis TaxID=1337665 RepID=UPI00312EFEC3
MSSKGAKAGASAKAKKPTKSGTEDKREDVLQAVIIADSFQTRFRPFTLEKPRCLLPLANTPLLEYTLEFLAMNGVQEVFIYASSFQEQIESYIRQSRWTPISRSCPFSTVDFIRVADARSVGDFLRDLDKRGLIEGDFVLVHGDLVSNISLDGALSAHRARKEANRDSIMTMVLREGGEDEHRSKVNGISPVFAVDPLAKRCLHYEEMNPLQSDHYIELDTDLLKQPELEIRSDLIDAQIDICTPDVLALWSESFDYELPRANYLHGVLKDYELNGKMIHTEIVSEGLRCASDEFPNLRENNVYREDEVTINDGCDISNAVIGQDTVVGFESIIENSIIGRNCKIGKGVRITNSIIWEDVAIDDNAVVEHSIVAEFTTIGKNSCLSAGCLIGSGVAVGEGINVPSSSIISVISAQGTSVAPNTELLGPQGKGTQFIDPDMEDMEDDDPQRLQLSLGYSLEGYELYASSVSTLASDDEEDLSDDEVRDTARSGRTTSFASDDSSTAGASNFVTEAVAGLLEVLRGERGDFDSEKLEFTSLRLANDASDNAVRRAVATALVRRAVELINAESGGMETSKAAKCVLTERSGAKEFVSEVGVGGDSVAEQVDFTLAVQRACVSISRVIEVQKAGALCSALFQQMYSEDILEEEGILKWWEDARAKEGGEAMEQVREKCKALVDWLEDAEEEDSDEESDED